MSKKRYNKPTIKKDLTVEMPTVKENLTVQSVVKEYLTCAFTQVLTALIIIGGIIRFYDLSGKSLWLDEATTYVLSSYDLGKIWAIGFTGDNNPPLFHWITHFMLTFGNSEFILRFLPVVMGILTIPIVYCIGKEFKGRSVGLIAAALVTFSPFCIHYAREAYSYSMVLFVSSLVILFYLKAINTRDTKMWVVFGALSALAFWTHFYTFVPLMILYAHALYAYRKEIISKNVGELKNIAYALITTAILASPVMYMAISRYLTISSKPVTYGVLGVALIPETLYRFSGFDWSVAIIFVVLSVIGLAYLYTKTDKSMFLLSAMFFVLPITISVILSSKMTMNPRYLIYLLPIVFVTIAYAYVPLSRLISPKSALCVMLILAVVVNAFPLIGYYSLQQNEDWRSYAGKLTNNTFRGDTIVAVPGYISTPLGYYYNNKTDGTIMMYADTEDDLNTAAAQKVNGNVYFVVTGDISAINPQGNMLQWFKTKSVNLGQYSGIYTFSV